VTAGVSLDDLNAEALRLLDAVPEGDPLDAATTALIALAVRAAPTVLDADGIRCFSARALAAGASAAQIHDTLVLVAGVGFHTLAEGSRHLVAVMRQRGDDVPPLDERRRRLHERCIGPDAYWGRLEAETPGFVDALLRLSPEAFEAFVAFVSVPWRGGALPAPVKELICMAVDATPTHRYRPGVRLHLANAVDLGVGRAAVIEALTIAAAAPLHRGVA
jgi:alkylhydroperoxidase/carboxymuconolactone decarboxylase family protein YurZ